MVISVRPMKTFRPQPTCFFVSLFLFILFIAGTDDLQAQSSKSVAGVYRVRSGIENGFEVWIVDGKKIREQIFPEFLYGGNSQRYRFVPENEIWIDHAISCEEYGYTLLHEIREYRMMARYGLTYDAAHDSALMLEQGLRLQDLATARNHEAQLQRVSPTDSYGQKEISRLGDSLFLRNVYRVYLGRRDSVDVWIVDGAVVRRDVFPDFGLSGNDCAYHFIPRGELWLDSQVSCEEMEFSIQLELLERIFMSRGQAYEEAYESSLFSVAQLRRSLSKKAGTKPAIVVREPLTRDKGTGSTAK